MSLIKVITLGILAPFCFIFAQKTTGIYKTIGYDAFYAVSFLLLLSPTLIAITRKHEKTVLIILLNIFLSFTVIGWIIALIWASKSSEPEKLSRSDVLLMILVSVIIFAVLFFI
jgi:hypothetical protein